MIGKWFNIAVNEKRIQLPRTKQNEKQRLPREYIEYRTMDMQVAIEKVKQIALTKKQHWHGTQNQIDSGEKATEQE